MLSYMSSPAGVTIDLRTGRTEGGHAEGDEIVANFEGIIGSSVNDRLTGDRRNNRLLGGAGVDELYGGDGNDSLIGGAGADHLDGDGGDGDWVILTGDAGLSVDLGNQTGKGGDAEGDTYVGIEHVLGSSLADDIRGNNQDNSLLGGAGDDFLSGGAGGDTLDGGDGELDAVDYSVSGGGVTVDLSDMDTERGGTAAGDVLLNVEVLTLSGLADKFTGGSAAESVLGGAGNDELLGGVGNDSLFGGTGADSLSGGDGADFLDGGDGEADWLTYGAGAGRTVDLSSGSAAGGDAEGDRVSNFEHIHISDGMGNDNLFGSDDAGVGNILIAGEGSDRLLGRGGNDTLYGADFAALSMNDGRDLLEGGEGNDSLIGGNDADVYIYRRGSGSDVIFDRPIGTERLEDALAFGPREASGAGPILHTQLWFERSGGGLRVRIVGTPDSVLIRSFFSVTADAYTTGRIELIRAGGMRMDLGSSATEAARLGHFLDLIRAMAARSTSFDPTLPGNTSLPTDIIALTSIY